MDLCTQSRHVSARGEVGRASRARRLSFSDPRFARSSRFSLQTLRGLYTELLHIHREYIRVMRPPSEWETGAVETIRVLSEVIVFGEQQSSEAGAAGAAISAQASSGRPTASFFDYFCEKNMLALLVDMARAPGCSPPVQTQVVQTISILVQNVRNQTSL